MNTAITHRVKRSLVLAIKTLGAASLLIGTPIAHAALGEPEKDELTFGFIKLTDMAPIAIAYENGYFEDEGLYVTIEAQANWKVLLDGVIDGKLDGAHMLAGQPLAATIGYGTKAHIVTPFSMDLNGNAITVSNDIWAQMKPNIPTANGKPVHPIKADAMKPIVDKYNAEGKPFNMGMVFPVSTHNYELRYWLAAGDIHPGFYAPHKGDTSGTIDAQALLSVTPPPQMDELQLITDGTHQGRHASEFSGTNHIFDISYGDVTVLIVQQYPVVAQASQHLHNRGRWKCEHGAKNRFAFI